jgi:chromosome segregation ATPase
MAVTQDNMTDSDKLELQQMLKESQEELERLWHHNKILVERLKTMESQHRMLQSNDGEEHMNGSEADAEVNDCLKSYERPQLSYRLRKDETAESSTAFRKLKDNFLSLHEETTQLRSDKAQLARELEERDAQLNTLSLPSTPDIERSLSLGALGSPEDPRVEVERLRSVVQDRDMKLDNLKMQLKTFQEVATEKADLDQQVKELEAQLKATEVCWNHVLIQRV